LAESKKKGKAVLYKYMGGSNTRTIDAKSNFGGRLPDGIGVDLEWNEANGWVCDVSDVDEEARELLLSEQERAGDGGFIPAFQDVTGNKRMPDNVFQERWMPIPGGDARTVNAMVAGESVPTSGLGEASASSSGPGTTTTGTGASTPV
jgi:hypothetical protein